MYGLAKQELAQEKLRARELEAKLHSQEKVIIQEQTNGERARDQFDQLDLKVQALEKRSEE
jgi:hypothetical protein